MSTLADTLFDELLSRAAPAEERRERDLRAARLIEASLTERQRIWRADKSPEKALLASRRSGKSYGADADCLIDQLEVPGTKVIIVCLTLKQARDAHWGNLLKLSAEYDLDIAFNETALRWRLPNGSTGFLAGAEKMDEIERLRGGEEDKAIIDEPGSFAPRVLLYLIDDIISPRLASRSGTLCLIGSPGQILSGPFYQATCPEDPDNVLRDEDGELILDDAGAVQPTAQWFTGVATELRYSAHRWTVQDNTALPHQWDRFVAKKRRRGWHDDHPTWRREYLGQWVRDESGQVYAYARLLAKDPTRVTWAPLSEPGSTKEAHGLPPGDWRTVLGVDLGFEDDFAMVVVAWSSERQEMRVLWDYKDNHLTVGQIAAELRTAQARFGPFTAIVADAGALGKLVVETFVAEYGIPVERADKTQKYDHIELVNSDFHSGRLKLIRDSHLAREMEELVWDLSKDSLRALARAGKLRESPRCPNHLCDALLYAWRFCYHRWHRTAEVLPEPGTKEHELREEERAFRAACARRGARNRQIAEEREALGVEFSWN
jgi:hypothetical protein